LGAGFHPDLTGRENVYLNASILGMGRAEIDDRLDEIVAFSELEEFIDMPLKHYSSGMRVRLGFSVAVHIDPEILLLDEVLAVGDQVFQQKCMALINKIKKAGTTIVLVSHGLAGVGDLCERVIWLQNGKIEADGSSTAIIDKYAAFSNERYYQQRNVEEQKTGKHEKQKRVEGQRWGTFQVEITEVELLGEDGSSSLYFETGGFFQLRIHYQADNRIENPAFGLAFYRGDDIHVNGPNSVQDGYDISYIEGAGFVDYVIEQLPLNAGDYELTVAIYNRNSTVAYDHHHRMYSFEVRNPASWKEEGVVHIPAKWHHIAYTNGHPSKV